MNNFTTKYSLNRYLPLIILCLLFIASLGDVAYAQGVRKEFKPRTSDKALSPFTGVTNYYLRGDFEMIGNTNITFRDPENNTGSNNSSMKYVNVDTGDPSILNSSLATLELPDPDCSEIIYAGLYWSGREHNVDITTTPTGNTFTVRRNERNYLLDKRKVKLKKQGQSSYIDVEADANDIWYAAGVDPFITGDESNTPSDLSSYFFVGYADITDYVRQHGVGGYYVGNIALKDGVNSDNRNGGFRGDGMGYFGGWGMVVIYKDNTKKWRDITVFDGFAYNRSPGDGAHSMADLPISGFRTALNGDVRVTVGVMAGEGDVNVKGDYFSVINQSGTPVQLNHSGNAIDDFFNSSIVTNGTRTPHYTNNTGIDIAKFDLPNTGNSIINNNQTSATFRYGTTGDAYCIYNIVFAVDAYEPAIEAENRITTAGVQHNGQVLPGSNLDFELDVRNKGTENIVDGVIEIPLPSNVHYVSANIQNGFPLGGGTVQWINPLTGDPSTTGFNTIPGGTIRWNIGTITLNTDVNTILAQLHYTLRVTDNCTVLTTGFGGCGLEIPINGTVTGTGDTSGTPLSVPLVREYSSTTCSGPIYDDFLVTIDVADIDCPDVVEEPSTGQKIKQFKKPTCENEDVIARDVIIAAYPEGTKFYDGIPNQSGTNEVTGDFEVDNTYYAVVHGAPAGCYLFLETVYEECLDCGDRIFLEDFGTSDLDVNFGRTTSIYMPGNSFIFGEPYPTSTNYDSFAIDNNHYAVVAPGYIKAGMQPYSYYFWTPAYNEANTVTDMSGTENGAVMVVNGGETLAPFYRREVTLEYDTYYHAAFSIYVVNESSQVGIKVGNSTTGDVYGMMFSKIFESPDKGKWIDVELTFKVPADADVDCDMENVFLEFFNAKAATQGNDYYIDNIFLEKLDVTGGCPVPTDYITLTCPSNSGGDCTEEPATGEPDEYTQTGISDLVGFVDGWPNNIPNGFIAIDSKDQGFVITRVAHVGGTDGTPVASDAIANPEEGMLVYDIQDNCVKLFNGETWNCLEQDCPPAGFTLLCNSYAIEYDSLHGDPNSQSGQKGFLPFANGDESSFSPLSVQSQGVTGLVANITLQSNQGTNWGTKIPLGAGGFFDVHIQGNPSGSGIATFPVEINGSACEIVVIVP